MIAISSNGTGDTWPTQGNNTTAYDDNEYTIYYIHVEDTQDYNHDFDDYKKMMMLKNRKKSQWILRYRINFIMPKLPIEKKIRKNNRMMYCKRNSNINLLIVIIILLEIL